jgi:hypothetical protein
VDQGICRNPACPGAPTAAPVDRYPGPGEFCPECGEKLEPIAPSTLPIAPPVPAAPPTPPFDGMSPLQALQRLERVEYMPPLRRRRRSMRLYAIASAVVVLATMVTGGALHQAAYGHPNGDGIRVCGSSISQRLASDVLAAYRTVSGRRSVELGRAGTCDVRFAAVWGDDAQTAAVVGRDAIVVVVNPQNPLVRLTAPQLRAVLTGEIADWSTLGAGFGAIGVVVPNEGTDEAALVRARILGGAAFTHDVRRVASTAAVVAAVTGAQGRRLIGIATFSGAAPAKAVTLDPGVPPNRYSIGDGHYPLIVGISVEAAGAAPPPAATDLVRYARSDGARAIAVRDGLVPSRVH